MKVTTPLDSDTLVWSDNNVCDDVASVSGRQFSKKGQGLRRGTRDGQGPGCEGLHLDKEITWYVYHIDMIMVSNLGIGIGAPANLCFSVLVFQ